MVSTLLLAAAVIAGLGSSVVAEDLCKYYLYRSLHLTMSIATTIQSNFYRRGTFTNTFS